jgi:NADP-reducing hydrogenase subunit HndB
MTKITVEDLKRIKEKTSADMALRQIPETARIIVHIGDCGIKAGARDVMKAFMDAMAKTDRRDIRLLAADCLDPENCANEPKVTIKVNGGQAVVYQNMTPEKAKEVFARHVLGGSIVTDYVMQ